MAHFGILKRSSVMILAVTAALATLASAAAQAETSMRFVQIGARDRVERSRIADLGISIEAVRSDSVWGFANENGLRRLSRAGFKILGNFDLAVGRGGHESSFDFPPADSRFHNYAQVLTSLTGLQKQNPDISRIQSIGKTLENRDIWAIHINSSPEALTTGSSNKPGAIFMGNHHAREHVSVEVPLMLADYLLKNRADAQVAGLLETRDIWIIPMVNPDGAEWDIQDGTYRYWRKNRRDNGDGTFGVDLNRNYGFKWGTGGSDKDTSSDIYMGPTPFSEPETRAIRDFIEAHLNAKVLLTFHTYSELVLYPWGHSFDKIGNAKDLAVFEKMATTMAAWNHYTPEQSSSLYIASGDTTDWAYGEHGIFAFTFELSPSDMADGGFYPGAGVLDKVFGDNLKPCLYLLDAADDPYKVVNGVPTGWLKNYVEPRIPESLMWETHPI